MSTPLDNESAIAERLAVVTAGKAAELATTTANTAVALASKTAETTAIISNDISWMKKSLSGIESTLNEMTKAFVTASQHQEVIKTLDEHSEDIHELQTDKTRTTVLLSIGIGILTLLVSLLTYHILGKG